MKKCLSSSVCRQYSWHMPPATVSVSPHCVYTKATLTIQPNTDHGWDNFVLFLGDMDLN